MSARNLACQNDSELDRRGTGSVARHLYVCRSVIASVCNEDGRSLTRRSQQLQTFPQSGRIVPEANDVNIREVFEGPYRIIYHVLEGEIDVIAVVHGARQWPEEP
jgi:ParE-like toxin of type II ParDE toxin-antitoxin system